MHCGRSRGGFLGLLIAGTALAARPVSDQSSRETTAKCSSCGRVIEGNFTWCPNCGIRMRPYPCDYCQGLVPVEAEDCPHCGAPTR